MSDLEWVHLTEEQLAADPGLASSIDRFRAPAGPAGDAAAQWLREGAIREVGQIATYVAVSAGEIVAFYSLAMGEVELNTRHRRALRAGHPRPGAVLILWLARAEQAEIDAATILRHAVGMAQIAARLVGAAVIAIDPFDAATEEYWRQRFQFRSSRTKMKDAEGNQRQRLWMALFP